MPDPLIGTKLGDYQIVELLGRGGMARVYRGYDEKLDRYAAVKVTDAEFVQEEMRDEYEVRFTREARAIAHMTHPNIVGVYQFGQEEGMNFMAMHFIEGEDLHAILHRLAEDKKVMPPEQVVGIMRDISAALDYAHRHGVIHRDIKPSNIMVTPGGQAILTDFGLALNMPEGTIGNTFGSAHYIAPEQAISSAQAVPQSDFYSLGIVLYEILTGQVPFDDPSTMSVALKHLNEPPPAPRTLNPNISQEVEDVVMHMLRKEPAERYPNGATMSRELEKAFNLPLSPPPDEEDTTELPVITPAQAAVGPIPKPGNVAHVPTPSGPEHTGETANTLIYSGTPQEPKPGEQSAAPAAAPAPQKRRKGGGCLRSILLLLLIIAIAVGGLLVGLRTGRLDPALLDQTNITLPEPIMSFIEQIMPTATAGADEAPTAESTPGEAATDEATAEPDASATPEPEPTATDTPAAVSAAASDTSEPGATPRPTATPGGPHLLLVYDEEAVQITNISDEIISIMPLMFRYLNVEGEDTHSIFFKAEDLADSAEPPESFSPGHCYLIWPRSLDKTAQEITTSSDACDLRVGWRMLSEDRLFWRSERSDATFEVVGILTEGEVRLATCDIAAGRCEVTLPYEDE